MRKPLLALAAVTLLPLAAHAQNTINTVVGGGPTGLAPTSASLGVPVAVTQDASGNVYVADTRFNRVYKISGGTLTVFAGNGVMGYSGDGGLASNAELSLPSGLAVDSSGDVYIALAGSNVVREVVASTGDIKTVAGNGTAGYTGDGGSPTNAELKAPQGLALDSAGDLFIADTGNNVIREVPSSGATIQTVAGNGTAGYAGDGAAATGAELSAPVSVFVDPSGNLFIADRGNNVIREVVAATKAIKTVAGNGTAGASGDGGAATQAELNAPSGVALDGAGNIYISDTNNNIVRKVTVANGNIQTIAGNGIGGYSGDGGAAIYAELNAPKGLYVDSSGNVFIADSANSLIRELVAVNGTIHSFAGNGTLGLSGDGSSPIDASLNLPTGVALDGVGDIYIADSKNNVIREVVKSTGIIQTAAGRTSGSGGNGNGATSAPLNDPTGVFVDPAGNLFIADTGNNVIREVVAATGNIQTISTGAVTLSSPTGVFVDGMGDIFIADTGNNVIREIPGTGPNAGQIKTVAGNGTAGYSGDGGAATQAELHSPESVAVDGLGDIFIADTGNNVVREVVASSGNIKTVAGNGTAGYTGNGGAATSAELNQPAGVLLDASGDVFIADTGNSVIREVAVSTGNIQTVAGNGTANFSGDGGPATQASLNMPAGIAFSTQGDLYIADTANDRIREVAGMVSVPGVSLSAQSLTFTSEVNGTTSPGQSVTITNSGAAPLQVYNVTIAGTNVSDFAATNTCTAPLAPQGTCTATVTFTPQANGPRSAILAIADNAPGSPQMVSLTGGGTFPVTLTPGGLSFPLQFTGTKSSTQTATLTNNQNIGLNNISVSILDTNDANVNPNFTQTNTCGTSLPAGGTCTISVTFAPAAGGTSNNGAIAAILSVTDNAVNSPQQIGLSGIASSSTATPSPTSLTFGVQTVDVASATQVVTISNTGPQPLTVSGVSITGADDGDFSQTNTCTTAAIASNGTCKVTVTFSPIAPGTRTAFLTLTDSAGDSPQNVPLTGTAIDFSISAPTGDSTTATVTAGQNTTYALQVTASGGTSSSNSLTVALACSGAPAGVTCTIAPASVTVTPATPAPFTVTVRTTATTAGVLKGPGMRPFVVVLASLMLMSLWLLAWSKRQGIGAGRRRRAAWAATGAFGMLLLMSTSFLAGCGGSSTTTGTPAATYSLTITGTSGTDTRSLVVSLVVNASS
ncbi:MAG TPA: choice-of-anchor D domain-containing protein [Candidatus Acidoferrales bacterium]|nr:choice-of-anchor D domain-containing protein [Candidatus Acidoferrales bacterium]